MVLNVASTVCQLTETVAVVSDATHTHTHTHSCHVLHVYSQAYSVLPYMDLYGLSSMLKRTLWQNWTQQASVTLRVEYVLLKPVVQLNNWKQSMFGHHHCQPWHKLLFSSYFNLIDTRVDLINLYLQSMFSRVTYCPNVLFFLILLKMLTVPVLVYFPQINKAHTKIKSLNWISGILLCCCRSRLVENNVKLKYKKCTDNLWGIMMNTLC